MPRSGSQDNATLNTLSRELHDRLERHPEVMLTQTLLKSEEHEEGIYCLRFAMGGLRTTMDDVLETWRLVEAEG